VLEYTHGRGSTVSIDAACVKNSLLLLLQATGNAGRVITMGFSTAPTEVNQFLITSKELDVRGSRLQNKMYLPEAFHGSPQCSFLHAYYRQYMHHSR